MLNADLRSSRGSPAEGALSGRVVGNFELGTLIGAGAMGEVYEARHLTSRMPVAVKLLHRHLLANQDLVRRFRREARSAAALKHPHSVLILESDRGEEESDPYIAMELLDGCDLAQVLRRESALPIPRAIRILSQVLSAVGEAHAQHIVHRDLKPSNIMLVRREGTPDFVKVCDFGIAKIIDPRGGPRAEDTSLMTAHGMLCGTPEYMAPEQARAEILDGRADLYSAAVILYQLVTGDVPFRAPSPMGVLSRQITEVPQPPSLRRPDLAIPRALEGLILRGLAKDREGRPQNAGEFRAELERIEAEDGRSPGALRLTDGAPPRAATLASRAPAGAPPTMVVVLDGRNHVAPAAARRRRSLTLLVLGATLLVFGGLVARGRRPSLADPPARPVSARAAPPRPLQPPVNSPDSDRPGSHPIGPAASFSVLPGGRPDGLDLVRGGADRHARNPDSAAPGGRSVRGVREQQRRATAAERALTLSESRTVGPPPLEVMLTDGDKLIVEGRIEEGCARLEEAKSLYPAKPVIYKLLGQCYMRFGRPSQAKANYRRYLELHPDAPDAAFIISMVN